MNHEPTNAGSYYVDLGANRYQPTAHTGGAWDAEELHFSPLGGLITHAIQDYCDQDPRGLVVSRIGFDILGRLSRQECEIQVHTLRPGRTIELVEAVAQIGDRTAVRARAWLLAPGDTRSVAGGAANRLPDPDGVPARQLTSVWPGGYIASLEVRPIDAAEPGRARVWVSTDHPLLQDRRVSPLASFVALVDTANGVAVREAPTEWMFPNVDLTVHFHRQPRGPWVGLDTTVVFGPTGQGLTSTVLHDHDGQVGHAQQILTVRPLDPGTPST